MSYLQCPECRLTVPAAAYYLRGDQCPRCLTPMHEADRFTRGPAETSPRPAVAATAPPAARHAAQAAAAHTAD